MFTACEMHSTTLRVFCINDCFVIHDMICNTCLLYWKVKALVIVDHILVMERCSQNSPGMTKISEGYLSARCTPSWWSSFLSQLLLWRFLFSGECLLAYIEDKNIYLFIIFDWITVMSCLSCSEPVKFYIQTNPGWYWAS